MQYSHKSCRWLSIPYLRTIAALAFLITALGVNLTTAQQVVTNITPDTTLHTNSMVTPNGNLFDITKGTAVGSNLFHSFQEFSVSSGDIANFVDPGGVANILSRVTGANVSNIFGQLRSDSSANLFFLNPNGIVFGPESSLDIGGSFHVSTADFIRLGDGPGLFSALDPASDILISAPPSTFGFLSSGLNNIDIQSTLKVGTGEATSIVGAQQRSMGKEDPGVKIENGSIIAPNGQINIVSVSSSGEVPFDVFSVDALELPTSLGDIELTKATLDTSGSPNGSIAIRGGDLTLINSNILAQVNSAAAGTGKGGDLTIDVNEFSMSGGSIALRTSPSNTANIDGGNFTLNANGVTIKEKTIFSVDSFSKGDGGTLTINANIIDIQDDVSFNARTYGEGNAGDILLNVDTLTTKRVSLRTGSRSPKKGSGNAGNIIVRGTSGDESQAKTITLLSTSLEAEVGSGGSIDPGEDFKNDGEGGFISLAASEAITLNGTNLRVAVFDKLVNEKDDPSKSGRIEISTPIFDMTSGGLRAATFGSRKAGTIDVLADKAMLNRRKPPRTRVPQVIVQSQRSGDAGTATFKVGEFEGTGPSFRGKSEGSGKAGSIEILARDSIQITGGRVSTTASGTGEGGDITITSPKDVNLTDLLITADVKDGTTDDGSAAMITVEANDLTITGGGSSNGRTSSITARSTGTRDAGNIILRLDSLSTNKAILRTGSESSEKGSGNAGNIIVRGTSGDESQAKTITLLSTSLEAEVGSGGSTDPGEDFKNDGEGGFISLAASEAITLNGTNLRVAVFDKLVNEKDDPSKSGRIEISTPIFDMTSGGLRAATFGSRKAGTIDVLADKAMLNRRETPRTRVPQVIVQSQRSGDAGTATFKVGEFEGTGPILRGESEGSGKAGSIEILARDSIQITGGRVSTTASGTGEGGDITITSPKDVNLTDLLITADVKDGTTDDGSAAMITVEANDLTITGGGSSNGRTSSITARSTGTRDAGNITFNVGILTTRPGTVPIQLEDGTGTSVLISSSSTDTSTNAGSAGTVTIQGFSGPGTIAESVTILNSEVSTTAIDGTGGNVIMAGEAVILGSDSLVSAETTGLEDAGSLTIGGSITDNVVIDNSTVRTSAIRASGGDIKVNARRLIQIVNSHIESAVQGDATTQGGNISIDPDAVVIQNSQILANATNAGAGGNIEIAGNVVLVDAQSTLDASSNLGVSGSVNIEAPIQNLSGTIAPLPETIIETATLYGAHCAAQKGSEFSSLYVRGRDRIPPEPGDYLWTPLQANVMPSSISRGIGTSSTSMAAHQFGFTELEFQKSSVDPMTSFDHNASSLTLFNSGC